MNESDFSTLLRAVVHQLSRVIRECASLDWWGFSREVILRDED